MPNWFQSTTTDVNSTKSLAGRARTKRWEHMVTCFPSIAEMRVLDLGGTTESWRLAPVQPKSVTVINLMAPTESGHPSIVHIQGDACNLPRSVSNEHFDLVYSNSLIEHVGGHANRQRLADNVHARADRHWVQTPYRYFPIEPHWVFPGMQCLPYKARVTVSLRWNRGHVRTYTRDEAESRVNEIDLLSISQMRHYFPTSTIWHERFAGLVKSVTALKQ